MIKISREKTDTAQIFISTYHPKMTSVRKCLKRGEKKGENKCLIKKKKTEQCTVYGLN